MNYANMAASVLKKIKKNGKPITLNRTTGGSFNAATGLTTGATVTQYAGYALETDYAQVLLAGGDVENDVKKLLVSFTAGAISPVVGSDTVTVDGSDWKLLKANSVSPGSVVLFYEVEVS